MNYEAAYLAEKSFSGFETIINFDWEYDASTVSLLDMLFHSQHANLIGIRQKLKMIALLKFLIRQSINALHALKLGEYSEFDAQVGENVCQARACFLLDLSDYQQELCKEMVPLLIIRLHQSLKILKYTESEYKIFDQCNNLKKLKEHKNSVTLYEFIKSQGILFYFPKILMIVMKCYLLKKFCIIDKNGIPIRIDFNKMQNVSGLSKHFIKRTIHLFQKDVSLFSTQYTNKIAASYYKDDFIVSFLKKTIRISDENRYVFPCYDGMKIFFLHLFERKRPVIFIINRYEGVIVMIK